MNESLSRNDTLAQAVREFFAILDQTEESDGGNVFHPTTIDSCRVLHTQKLNELLPRMKALAALSETQKPIPMLLFCPRCGKQHVDAPKGDWTNPPHATHTCQFCDLNWRPSNALTEGVAGLASDEAKHVERFMATNPAFHTERRDCPYWPSRECHTGAAKQIERSSDKSRCVSCEALASGPDRGYRSAWEDLAWELERKLNAARSAIRPAETGPLKLDTEREVFFYEQDHYYLSNFSAFKVRLDGWTFDTSEHAYQAEKFPHLPELRGAIHTAPSAHAAFKLAEANRDKVRTDWPLVKVHAMLAILRAKAEQHEYVRRKLLETGERELIENSWRDDFWGWGPNRDGKNTLGKCWMIVRDELRRA